MMRGFVVINPEAGGGRTRRLWPSLRDRLSRLGFDFDFAETTGPGTASNLAKRAVEEGWRLVVAVGGDGTVNEVVNGLTDATGRARASLGAVLTGRGRDTCRNIGLPVNPEEAAQRIVAGEEVTLDLGAAEWEDGRRRYFLNAAGAGLDGAVAERTQRGSNRGRFSYPLALLQALLVHRPGPAKVCLDGQPLWSGPTTAAVVANGRYYGGGMKIAPAADTADGRLDLIVLRNAGRLELLCWLPAVYRGKHLRNPKVTVHRGHTISVEATPPLPVHLDGEIAGKTPVRFSVRPKALRFRR